MYLFFVQAEDGIRDLVRSRGLGDVYKRQAAGLLDDSGMRCELLDIRPAQESAGARRDGALGPVSYTHLTLPTSDLV